ncbi:MAG: hypothetical protein HRT77_17470 [Halioglobus sp.]|jgi:hypothetical protein|nr:hypothetical protein [Halioglobus sp.]
MRRSTFILVLLLWAGLPSAQVQADGGVVRASESVGPWRITVFSAPVPLRAGPADISVFVQDQTTRKPLLTARVDVVLTDELGQRMTQRATRQDATNRLMYAALVTLPTAGRWSVDVTVQDGQLSESISLEVDVGPAWPPWTDHLPWLVLPLVGLGLFAGHQVLAARHQSRLRP